MHGVVHMQQTNMGRVWCRHIFENRKYVEEYRTEDVERELGLDRDGLIRLALLLGSDYTEGVAGIGIVNAVEVPNIITRACAACC